MRDNEKNTIIRQRKRAEFRRKRVIRKFFVLFFLCVILAVNLFYIKNIKLQMAGIHHKLNQMEGQQSGTTETMTKAEEIDYVRNVGIVSVGKPEKLTSAETTQRLKLLGENNPMIDEISKNAYLYPESMLTALANNPEMADFVSGYLDEDKSTVSTITQEEKEQKFPLFLQWDPRWGYQSYGSDSNIGLAGCGPTCLAMVLYYLTEDEMFTPDKIAAYAMENDYYVEGAGTAWSLMEDIPQLYHIGVRRPALSESAICVELDKGNIIICAMKEGDFTVSGHFIVIYGYDKQGFIVNDPNCVARSRRIWSFDEIETQINSIWSYGNQ